MIPMLIIYIYICCKVGETCSPLAVPRQSPAGPLAVSNRESRPNSASGTPLAVSSGPLARQRANTRWSPSGKQADTRFPYLFLGH